MGTIKEEAQAYEPKQTKTISELDKVSIDLLLTEDKFEVEGDDGKPKDVLQNIVTIEGEDYRVPNSVLKTLKILIANNPELEFFRVVKEGEGMKTSYTVIPL